MSNVTPKPSRVSPKIFLLVVAVPLLVAANVAGNLVSRYFRTQQAEATKPGAPEVPPLFGLTVEANQLDLGEVWETPSFVAKLTLTNTTSQDLTVERFSTSCECSKVDPPTIRIPAGKQSEVSVHIDLTHRMPHQLGVEKRELSLPIRPVVKYYGVPAGQWTIQGIVCTRVSLADRVLQFGDVAIHGGTPVSRSVRCNLHQPGVRVEAAVPAERGTVSVSSPDANPSFVQVSVTPNPKTPIGPFRFEVPLTVVRADGVREPGPVLEVLGEMRSPFLVTPSQLLLGEHPVGTTAEAEFSVTLPPGTDFTVKQVGSDSTDTSVQFLREDEKPNGEKCRVYQVRQVVAAGDKTASVEVVLGNARGEKETVRVGVTGFGSVSPVVKPK